MTDVCSATLTNIMCPRWSGKDYVQALCKQSKTERNPLRHIAICLQTHTNADIFLVAIYI